MQQSLSCKEQTARNVGKTCALGKVTVGNAYKTRVWSGCWTRVVSFRGSLRDGVGSFDGYGGSGEHLALLLLLINTQDQEATLQ